MTATIRAGVIGAGTMGFGIAYVLASSGHATTVVESDAERRAGLLARLESRAQAGVDRGRLDPDAADALPGLVSVVGTVEELRVGLDVVIETVPERLNLKRAVLAAAADRRPGLLATNTSSYSIDDLAAELPDPQRFCGMHFFNPVWSIALVEVVRGKATADGTIAAAQAAAAAIGKESIVVANVPGFATSRLDCISAFEAMRMLEEGVAAAEDIDRAAEVAYGHPIGPLRLSDVVGLDVRLDIARHLQSVYGERYAPPAILEQKVAAGELGRKSGQGFFDWTKEG